MATNRIGFAQRLRVFLIFVDVWDYHYSNIVSGGGRNEHCANPQSTIRTF